MKTFRLHCYLAECAGYDRFFRENDDGTLTDAENVTVPSLSDLCLRKPELIGLALAWILENGNDEE